MYCLKFPLFVHFSFSLTRKSVTNFSAPFFAKDFKFYRHLDDDQVYCVNAYVYFAFFFFFLAHFVGL